MTALVGALVAATLLLTVAVVDALRLHGRALRRLHEAGWRPSPARRQTGDRR